MLQDGTSVPHQLILPTGCCAEECKHAVVQWWFFFFFVLDILVIKAIPRDSSGGSLCQAHICMCAEKVGVSKAVLFQRTPSTVGSPTFTTDISC